MSILLGNGGTKNVKEIYIGVNGDVRKVKEGYVGVGGVPKKFYQSLPPKGKTLETYTWDEISAISKAGLAQDYGLNVGDIKSITFNGEPYYVQIIGFDHDDVVDAATYGREKAGITFQFGVGHDKEKAGMYSQTYPMNNSNTNVGGWEQCLIRTSTMPLMKSYMQGDLRNVIVPVKKFTSAGDMSSNIITTNDDLWLLSEVEIFGYTKYSVSGEGEQYAFYKYGRIVTRYNTNGSTDAWWERSTNASNKNAFCSASSAGGPNYYNSSNPHGVSFGFCV